MTKKPQAKAKAEELSFEQAMAELERIVGAMESGETPLAESLEQYERGAALIKRCRGLLADAEKKIELLTESGGKLATQPLEADDAEEP